MADITNKPPFEWNPENPLSRAKGESRKANDALNGYFGLGMGRSIVKLRQTYSESGVKTRYSTIAGWSVKFAWQARVSAQSELDHAADRVYWAQQRREIQQADLNAAVALRERAERMRNFPVAEQKTVERYDDGREKTIIIKPAKWREADIARIETTASDLARRAAEMHKEKIGIEITPVKMENMSDEELARVVAGESAASVLRSRKGGV